MEEVANVDFFEGEKILFGLGSESETALVVDPKSAIKHYKSAAAQNHPMALVRLGECYEQGLGVEVDQKKACRYYRQAADLNSSIAMYNLASCYEHGMGVERNLTTAMEWYSKSAEQNYSEAQRRIGFFYEKGIAVTANLEVAVNWYQQAAASGNPAAQTTLGYCYHHGIGVEVNHKVSLKYYQDAAETQYPPALDSLGLIYQNGFHSSPNVTCPNESKEEDIDTDKEKAFKYYEIAANLKYAPSQFNLGFCYENGIGVEKDKNKAIECYQKAADQNYPLAIIMLANYYEQAKDRKQSSYWHSKLQGLTALTGKDLSQLNGQNVAALISPRGEIKKKSEKSRSRKLSDITGSIIQSSKDSPQAGASSKLPQGTKDSANPTPNSANRQSGEKKLKRVLRVPKSQTNTTKVGGRNRTSGRKDKTTLKLPASAAVAINNSKNLFVMPHSPTIYDSMFNLINQIFHVTTEITLKKNLYKNIPTLRKLIVDISEKTKEIGNMWGVPLSEKIDPIVLLFTEVLNKYDEELKIKESQDNNNNNEGEDKENLGMTAAAATTTATAGGGGVIKGEAVDDPFSWGLNQLNEFVVEVEKYRTKSNEEGSTTSHREKVRQEIYNTELTYGDGMQIVFDYWQKPMLESLAISKKPLATAEQITIMFSSLKLIHNLHVVLLQQLKENKDNTGDIFLKFADLAKLYIDYVNKFEEATATYQKLRESNKNFKTFDDEIRNNKTSEQAQQLGQGLVFLLITPVQRLPRYQMLLEALLKHTDPSHPDYNNISQAVSKMTTVNFLINQRKSEYNNRTTLANIDKKLKIVPTGPQSTHSSAPFCNPNVFAKLGENFSVLAPHRMSILEGSFEIESSFEATRINGHAYLMNDILLVTKEDDEDDGNQYHYILDILELKNFMFKDGATNEFGVVTGEGCWTFYCCSATEKQKWTSALMDTAKSFLSEIQKKSDQAKTRKKDPSSNDELSTEAVTTGTEEEAQPRLGEESNTSQSASSSLRKSRKQSEHLLEDKQQTLEKRVQALETALEKRTLEKETLERRVFELEEILQYLKPTLHQSEVISTPVTQVLRQHSRQHSTPVSSSPVPFLATSSSSLQTTSVGLSTPLTPTNKDAFSISTPSSPAEEKRDSQSGRGSPVKIQEDINSVPFRSFNKTTQPPPPPPLLRSTEKSSFHKILNQLGIVDFTEKLNLKGGETFSEFLRMDSAEWDGFGIKPPIHNQKAKIVGLTNNNYNNNNNNNNKPVGSD